MFDKNTLRIDKGGKVFMNVIQKIRTEGLAEIDPDSRALQPYDNRFVKVFLRKRPIFDKDLEQHDFDCVTVKPEEHSVTLHNCLYEGDLKRPYIQHNSFHLDYCFDERVTNEEVYNHGAKGLVDQALKGDI